MQYCSLQHWTLLLSPVTSTPGYCFCFGSIPLFFLELFLHIQGVAAAWHRRAEKSYSTFKVRRGSHEKIPLIQGMRNPSKMVGVERGHQRADTLKPHSQKTSQSNHTRTTALSNSMKPSHACRATQDGWVMVERSDRMWSTGEGNGKPLQYSCLENSMNSRKRQNDRIPKEELPRSLGAQYATGDQ